MGLLGHAVTVASLIRVATLTLTGLGAVKNQTYLIFSFAFYILILDSVVVLGGFP